MVEKNPECSAGFLEGMRMEVSSLMGLPINSAGAKLLSRGWVSFVCLVS